MASPGVASLAGSASTSSAASSLGSSCSSSSSSAGGGAPAVVSASSGFKNSATRARASPRRQLDPALSQRERKSLAQKKTTEKHSASSKVAGGGSINKRGEVSLNHLINFSFPPRSQPISVVASPRRRKQSQTTVPYNKEKFMNSNYRFILKPSASYAQHLRNPDSPISWSNILQVVIPFSSGACPTCPICLSDPVAPRVTRCGHVFCYPCFLRYLDESNSGKNASAGGEFGTCPVCLEWVAAREVRPVIFKAGIDVIKGCNTAFTLMKRQI
ncbi:hypothetical protein HDU83_009878, partial [Entophlyctis luteolus]